MTNQKILDISTAIQAYSQADIIMITLLVIILIALLFIIMLRIIPNKHNDIIKYYLSKSTSEIKYYYYISTSNLKEIFSPDCSSLFLNKTILLTLRDLKKVIDNEQFKQLQERISLKMEIIKKQQHEFKNDDNDNDFHHYLNSQRNNEDHIIINFLDDTGKKKFIECKTEIISNQKNYPIGLVTWFKDVSIDIVDTNTLQEKLSQYAAAHNQLMETSTRAIAIYSSDTKIKYFNTAFTKLWDLDKNWLLTYPTYGELLEKLRQKRRVPEEADFVAFKRERMKLFTHLDKTYSEFMHLPSGRSLKVTITPHVLGGLMITSEDMTARLELERSFKTSSSVQKAILDHLHEAIAVYGQDGKLKLYNPEYLKLVNLPKEKADKHPHIDEILELKKDLFVLTENNWASIKNDMIATLYERELHGSMLNLKDGLKIYRTIIPLPDGATLITYINTTDLINCKSLLRDRTALFSEFFNVQSQFIDNINEQISSMTSTINKDKTSKQYTDNLKILASEVKKQKKEAKKFFQNLNNKEENLV